MEASDQIQSNNHDNIDELDSDKTEFSAEEIHEEALLQLQAELKEAKDRSLRTMADMENLRKRTEREKLDIQKYAVENLVKDLVPFLDSIEKAVDIDNEKKSDASSSEGVGMIYKQFLSTLTKHGLEVIQSAGLPFNPNFHQGIQKIETADVTVDTVQTEFAKGYMLNGRLIRPAIGSVLVPTKNSAHPHNF